MATEPEVASMDYETAVAELERTVQLLGKDQDDLDASVRMYEQGLALARRCTELLNDAERRLRALAPISEGTPST